MHRGFKLAFYGLVLAGLIGGTAAWANDGKSVTVRVDGHDQRVHTSASDVQGVLGSAHLQVGPHDIVAPDLTAKVKDGAEIVVRRGHLLHLSVDGKAKDVWVNADSVDEALKQLGYDSRNLVSVSRSTRLDSGATAIDIDRPKHLTFTVDGKAVKAVSPGPTIYQAIADAGLYIGPKDRLVAAGKTTTGTATIKDNEAIAIQRVRYGSSAAQVATPFKSVKQNDPANFVGVDSVVANGKEGVERLTYQLVYVDGRLASKVVQRRDVVAAPVNQVTKVGTKPLPANGTVPAGAAQQIAAGMVAAKGWSGDQFGCLVSLWNKESGWRTDAANPSGAYGIPQALPGSKMATAGADWQTSAATQITWGLSYIAGVYGTPCAAWGHSQATNWY